MEFQHYEPVRPQRAVAIMAIQRVGKIQLANDLDVSRHHLGRVLNGQRRASRELQQRIADYLGVTVEEAFDHAVPVVRA